MCDLEKARLVGINHVALEVGDVEAALEFYGRIFEFELRGSKKTDEGRRVMAFIDMADQFLALSEGRTQEPDHGRHFGLVVNDRLNVDELARAAGAIPIDGSPFNYLDPWGNRIEIVEYRNVQFSKTDAAMAAVGGDPAKSDETHADLRVKGIR